MLTSKHHNLNKLVWRYGLTSAAAVLLAFGGGASSVKAEGSAAPLTSEQRQQEIEKLNRKSRLNIQNLLKKNTTVMEFLAENILITINIKKD